MAELMDGITIDYTYSGGLRFVVRFKNSLASYKAVGETGGSRGSSAAVFCAASATAAARVLSRPTKPQQPRNRC